MSEKPIEKRCATCVHWEITGYSQIKGPPGVGECSCPIPVSAITGERYLMMPEAGSDCYCHTPKPETKP